MSHTVKNFVLPFGRVTFSLEINVEMWTFQKYVKRLTAQQKVELKIIY